MSRAVLVVLSLVVASQSWAAQPTFPVTACGDAVPPNTRGVLSADLDCTGFAGGIGGTAVSVGRNATLDLGGFTITGGLFGVGCFEVCPDNGTGACSDAGSHCTILNGTVTGATASGITGERVTVRNVVATGNGENGVQGYRRARAIDSTLTNNGDDGIRAWSVKVERCTVTGNGRHGAGGGKYSNGHYTQGVAIKESLVVNNAASLDCGTNAQPYCADVFSGTKPRVRKSTCGTSGSPRSVPGCGRDWCVCSND